MSGTDDESSNDNQYINDPDTSEDSLLSDYDDDGNVDQRYPNLYIYHRELYRLYQRNHKTMIDSRSFVESRAKYEIFKDKKVIMQINEK